MADKGLPPSNKPPVPPAAPGFAKPKASVDKPKRARRIQTRAILVREDDGEGNWLVSYADMMTLMFGFFVMISAFSVPNAAKFEEMKQQTAKAMGAKYKKPYEEVSASLREVLKELQLDKEVTVDETLDGWVITSKGTLFFDSGSAELKPRAQQLMTTIADILLVRAKGFGIVVEGHTDDVPVTSKQFPSNWELSSYRAGTVVRLFESKGFSRADLRPMGLADTEPVVPNRTANGDAIPSNQAENRRIVIHIQKQLPRRTSKLNK